MTLVPLPLRLKTSDEGEVPKADLSALESALHIVMSSESQLPDLLETAQSGEAVNDDSPPQAGSGTVFFICDVPSLPGEECKFGILAGQSEDDGALRSPV